MKMLLLGLLALGSFSAFADGFAHLNMRVELSGYGKSPTYIILHSTSQKLDSALCDENSWTGEYKCSVPMVVSTTTEKLFLSVGGQKLTNEINAKAILLCSDNSEEKLNRPILSSHNYLNGYMNISEAFSACLNKDELFGTNPY